MFGKLTFEAIPIHEPIIMIALAGVFGGLLLACGLLTYFGKWRYLWTEWITTVDHKRIGIMYIFIAIVMLIRGFADAIFMRFHLAMAATGTGAGFLPPEHYDQFFTAHGVIMIFFMAMPMITGLMNIVVPLQIGARDVAYPFLNALSFWLFMSGVLLVNISLGVGEFAKTGWLAYVPLSGKQFSPDVGVDYWIWSLQVAGLGTLLSGVNFIVTILKKRAPKMDLMKMPVFTWTALCTNILVVAAFPILTATVLMLTMDRYLDFHFFTNDRGGNQMMYVNLIWMWGHPEVYILILPAFGAFSEIVAVFSRKRIFGYYSLVWATIAITILSFMVWLHHFFTMGAGANVNAFFGIATMIIAIPTGIKIFNWLFTMYRGRIEFPVAMWWTLAFLIVFTIGGMTGVLLSVPGANFVLHNSMFVIAHFHNTIIGGTVFGVFAAINFWFPKAFGFKLNETLGKWSCGFWVSGFLFAFMPLYLLSAQGMTRRLNSDLNPEWLPLLLLASFGAVLVLLGIIFFIIQIVVSIKQRHKNWDSTGDTWNGRTLEWATASPPPHYNFAIIPQVASLDEFWEMKREQPTRIFPQHYEEIHMPINTASGFYIGMLATVFGFAMVWYIWWLALLSLAGVLICWLLRIWQDHHEYTIPAEEVAATERLWIERVRHYEAGQILWAKDAQSASTSGGGV